MNSKKLEQYKTSLKEMLYELVGDVDKTMKTSKSEEFTQLVSDVTDDAARSYDRQLILNLGEQGRHKLNLVEEALDRIKSGEFGICLRCEKNIPEARLKIVPFAEYCVQCLDAIEKETEAEKHKSIS